MNFIHFFSIRTKLFLIIAIAGLPLVLATIGLFYSQYQTEYNNAERAIQAATEAIANKHSAQVEGIRAQLVTISQFPEVRSKNKAACSTLLRNLLNQDPEKPTIGIADASGQVFASSVQVATDVSGRECFKEALLGKRFCAGQYPLGRADSKATMLFALPVLDASRNVTAVIFAVFDLDNFAPSFQSQILPANSVLNVTDRQGILVYRYPAHPIIKPGLKDRPDLRAHMTGQKSTGVFTEIGRDKVRRVLGYVRLQLQKDDAPYMYIRVSIPEIEIQKNIHKYLVLAGTVLVVMTFIALICSNFLAKRFLVVPIERLVEVARSVKEGDLSVRTGFVHSDNEIGMLAQSFDAMAESMEQRQSVLRASEQKFSSVFELSPITMALTSYPEGFFAEVNRAFSKTFGYSREEVMGKSTVGLNMWTVAEDRRRFFNKLEKYQHVSGFETVMRIKDGSLVTVAFTGSKVEIDGRKYTLSAMVDVTERKNVEKALQESEARFKKFFEESSDAFLILDDGNFIDCNKATVKMLGYENKNEIFKRSPAELSPERQPNGELSSLKASRLIALAFSTGSQRFEWSHLKADGTELPVEVLLTRMSLSEKQVLHVVWRDMSERKLLELREQTRLKILEEMAAGAPLQDLLDAIVCFAEKSNPGAVGTILLINDDGTQLLMGSSPGLPEIYKDAVEGLEIKHGMATSRMASSLLKRVLVADLNDHTQRQRFDAARKAGLRALWSEPILSQGGDLLGVFATFHGEPRPPSGDEMALIESAAHLASIAIGRSRDNQHRNLLEDNLRQMQKFEAIGQLAGGIAHDFNNLLTPILVYGEMIRLDAGENAPLMKKIEGILAAANKSKDLTQRLLSFGRKQMLDMRGIDLNEVILSFRDIMGRTVRESISFDLQLAPGGAPVMADRGQIEQILLNLAVNAQDAVKGNGKITVETGQVTFDDEYVKLNPGAKPGNYIQLAFTDNGCGMSEEVLQHVFEPFYTTKAVGQGTGLGLATVYGIVKQHDGYIKIRSRVGQGTTFALYLPEYYGITRRCTDPITAKPQHNLLDKTILFVDDNEMILSMATELLTLNGYRPMVASTPSQALALARSHAGSIDLLVTDVVMPEMTGPQLFERLTESRPELPVLYLSGYRNEVVLRSGTLEEEVNFLPKPFTAEQLIGRIQQALLSKPS